MELNCFQHHDHNHHQNQNLTLELLDAQYCYYYNYYGYYSYYWFLQSSPYASLWNSNSDIDDLYILHPQSISNISCTTRRHSELLPQEIRTRAVNIMPRARDHRQVAALQDTTLTKNKDDNDDGDDEDDVLRISYLPPEIIVDILKRLPAKTVFRCKLVHKFWHSLIHEPYFMNQILSNRPETEDLGIITLSCVTNYDNHQIQEASNERLSLHFFVRGFHKFNLADLCVRGCYQMSNSCNGLVCVYGLQTTCVVNPSIAQVLLLPQIVNYKTSTLASVALVHDMSTGEYAIIRLFNHGPDTFPGILGFEIFRLGSRSWRNRKYLPFTMSMVMFDVLPAVVNGVVYWMSKGYMITSFDIKTETFRALMVPFSTAHLLSLSGRLCLLVQDKEEAQQNIRHLRVATNMDSDSMEQWEWSTCAMTWLDASAKPVTAAGGKFMSQSSCGRFYFYGNVLDTRITIEPLFEPLYLPGGELYGQAYEYTKSLVSPIAIQQQQEDQKHLLKWQLNGSLWAQCI